jgi:FAD/FMN-containing dehydrogenase
VRALELVTADGAVRSCSPSENADVFAAARVGLGALGILVSVTLQTVPAFRLHAIEAARPLEGALELFDGEDDHVEFYWFPHTDVAATKRNNPTDADGPTRGRVSEWVGDELIGNGAFALVSRLGAAAPSLVPRLNRFAAGQFAHSEYVDRSYRVFTSPRRVRFLEMEYAVPRAALPDAFAGLRRVVQRHGQAVTFPVEVRVAAADDIPLSTAAGRDSAYLAVHVHRSEPHEAYFGAIEAVMRDLDGRPHWGKLHTRTAADLRPAYPGFDAFVALRDRLDPERRFGNAYLERVLG